MIRSNSNHNYKSKTLINVKTN